MLESDTGKSQFPYSWQDLLIILNERKNHVSAGEVVTSITYREPQGQYRSCVPRQNGHDDDLHSSIVKGVSVYPHKPPTDKAQRHLKAPN